MSHMHNLQNTNFNYVIGAGWRGVISNLTQNQESISLCHLVLKHVVMPILEIDVQLLENEIVNG